MFINIENNCVYTTVILIIDLIFYKRKRFFFSNKYIRSLSLLYKWN